MHAICDRDPIPELTTVLSRLDSLTNWESRPRGGMRIGLDPMLDLLKRLGDPHHAFRSVHVTGTKGKGSVCALIDAGLRRAGWRVGRYTSPHVERLTERISILGEPVDEAVLASALSQVLDVYEEAKTAATPARDATWFDVLTAAAFLVFQKTAIDVAVVEVGIGGRLDSTNVVNSTVAVVTNVELEHTEILGHTREAIAREKAGILKPGAALVTSLPAGDPAGAVLHERAEQLKCPVYCSEETASSTISERNVSLATLALTCLGEQGMICSSRSETPGVRVGGWLLDVDLVARTRLPGRMERFDLDLPRGPQPARNTIPIVLDGAHVPFNLAAVFRDLRRHPDLAGPCCVVLALGRDKNADGMMDVVKNYASVVICTELPRSGLSYSAEALSEKALVRGVHALAHRDPQEAFNKAVHLASERGGWVLVTGSLYLVGVVRRVVQDW